MGDTLALAASIRTRSDLAAELATLERRAGRARADLLHLDAVIRLLDPGAKPDAIPAKQPLRSRGWFGNGGMPWAVLDVLRPAPEPLTRREVATADEATFRAGREAGGRCAQAAVRRAPGAGGARRAGGRWRGECGASRRRSRPRRCHYPYQFRLLRWPSAATAEDSWTLRARRLLKAELKRQEVSCPQPAEMLAALGVQETKASITSKISRGAFTAAFLLQCMEAIGAGTLGIDES